MSKVIYKKLAKYPHLMPNDVSIWNRFIEKNPRYFSKVEYDVKVGKGGDYSAYPKSPIRDDLEYLSKKRIDVVGYSGNEVYVIEIKPKAGLAALGQAEGLSDLMQDEIRPEKIIIPVIITNKEIPDIRALCDKRGVLFLIA